MDPEMEAFLASHEPLSAGAEAFLASIVERDRVTREHAVRQHHDSSSLIDGKPYAFDERFLCKACHAADPRLCGECQTCMKCPCAESCELHWR